MTSRDPERSRSWLDMYGAEYLENVWRYRLGYNGAPTGNGTWGTKWSRARWRHVTLLPVSGYWGPGGGCALQTKHGVFRDTERQTISATRKQFMMSCLQKYCFRNHFEQIKYKSLEDSEEHCSVVCKLPFTVSHLQKRALPLLWFELILQLSSQHDAGSYLVGTFYGLVVHPGSKTFCHWLCPLTTVVVSDITRCLRGIDLIMQLTCNTTLYSTHYLCFYICLYHHPCLYLLVLFLFLLCFLRSSLFLLSGYNSVWLGCTMCIVIVWLSG